MRDACYGCFFRAGSIPDGPSQLFSLNDCARLYIQQSNYSACATNLQAIVDGNRPVPDAGPASAGFCYGGYCEFVRCVRRINTQQLILSCYNETRGTLDLTTGMDQIYFFTNITSCILAKTRCSQYNPITGELQNSLIRPPPAGGPVNVGPVPVVGTVPPVVLNALQITESGDMRILAFPTAITSVSDPFCAAPPPLLQAGFSTYFC
ncbi:uncharacterized protein LOC115633400 [Scaptodrosophila lebanonensis]|uniref:Uncharacterized protein LOC115633400 n=1 Tax=Drosophila lebanonensis TaxID=7225 RepID=A0A6J2UHQ7_DROLE|nr:uncharacterized protein LOC115633400 [Scaptodrosophila lebanonensis]